MLPCLKNGFSYHCSLEFPFPSPSEWIKSMKTLVSGHLGGNFAANPNPLSRSEQPQAVQSTSGWVTYGKGLAARRQHRSPKWPLAPIRTALEEKGNIKLSRSRQLSFCFIIFKPYFPENAAN